MYGPVGGERNDRETILHVSLSNDVEAFPFERFISQESFIIALLTRFEKTDDREILINAVSKMTAYLKVEGEDDGAGMNHGVKSGVNLNGEAEPPKIVTLKPFRTFRQVDQPESPFLFRYKKIDEQPVCAIFEIDGGSVETCGR